MQYQEFQQEALKTESKKEAVEVNPDALILMVVGLKRYIEVLDAYKKHIFYGKPLDMIKIDGTLDRVGIDLAYLRTAFLYQDQNDLRSVGAPVLNTRFLHGVMGMTTEAGELLEALGKHIAGGEIDVTNVKEEIGDSDWYRAILLDVMGLSNEEVLETVIAKLRKRYSNGSFNAQQAINRDVNAERQVLEGKE